MRAVAISSVVGTVNEAIALIGLAATLSAAVTRPRWAPDWMVAVAAAVAALTLTSFTVGEAQSALRRLGPTVGFLAALLVLADGARRAGVFDALGALMSRGARSDPRRLLAMVFFAASLTTAVLSLDSTIVLLTPIVFATAARLPTEPRPHVIASCHLANSASLLLPVSNLTNLLAIAATGLSFPRFAGLMVLPWLVAIGVDWVVLSRVSREDLGHASPGAEPDAPVALPWLALAVIALTLTGFACSSVIGVDPVWFAAAGAVALTLHTPPGSLRDVQALAGAAEPAFLVFVLALGVVVAAAGHAGLSVFVRTLLPGGAGLPALLAIAGLSALAANLLNNLPATLILLPALAAAGPVPVLAMLIGVGVGPNLTFVGSLATLLWRRILRQHGVAVDAREFLRLGLLTVPASLVLCTIGLWTAAQVL
jgi:arsenical pump membrane protein